MEKEQYRYSIKTRQYGTVLNRDTFCPGVMRQIDLTVYTDAQHDGHPWDESFIAGQEDQLVEEIMRSLRPHIEMHVKQTKPFAIHGY